MADDDFQGASGDASKSYPMRCSALRKNSHVLMEGHPCKIVEISTSKDGKHGHAKVHLVGIDIFTGKKYEDICPSTHNMEVPTVKRKNFPLVDINEDGFATLMDESGETRKDLKLPDNDAGKDIKAKFENLDSDQSLMVTVVKSMDQEMIMPFNPAK